MTRILTLLSLFTLSFYCTNSFSQGVKWGHAFGTKKNLFSNYVQYMDDVEFYGQSTVYAIGRFKDTLFVGKDTVLEKNGGMWLSKIDTSGHIHWTKSFLKNINPGSQHLFGEVYSIKADPIENCLYIGGYLQPGDYVFGSDTLSFPSVYKEFFIAKLDTSGNPIWGKISSMINPSTLPTNHIYDIDITAEGGIAITGFCSGTRAWLGDTIDLGVRGGGFVTKLDKFGNKQWTIPLESHFDTRAKSIQTNPDSSLVISGMFRDSLIIKNLKIYASGGYNVFFARIDKNGNPIWAYPVGKTNTSTTLFSCDLLKRGQHMYSAFSLYSPTSIPDINQTITPNAQGSVVLVKMDRYTGKILKASTLPAIQSSNIPQIFVGPNESNIHLLSEYGGPAVQNGITFTQGVNLTNIDSSGAIICNFPLNTSTATFARSRITGNNNGHIVMGSTLQFSRTLANVHLDNFGTQRAFVLSTDEGFCGDINIPIGSTDICERDSLLVSGPVGYSSYSWSNGDTSLSTYFHQGGLHYCYFTDTNGLYYISQSFDINMAASNISKSISGDSAVCPNDSIIISADSAWTNVIWNDSTSGHSIQIDTAGLYYFTAQDPLFPACTFYSDTIKVDLSPLDSITLTSLPDSICIGDSVRISLILSNSIDTNTIYLAQNGKIKSIQTNEWIQFDSLGTHTISVSADNVFGCDFYSNINLVSVVDTPISHITMRNDTLFSNMQFGNEWFKNDTLLPDTLDYHVVASNGIYTLRVNNSFGCSSTSFVNIGNVDLADPFGKDASIILYPNPSNEMLFIETTSEFATGNTLFIYDLKGAEMMSVKLNSIKYELNLTPLKAGIYVVKFHNSYFKLIKT